MQPIHKLTTYLNLIGQITSVFFPKTEQESLTLASKLKKLRGGLLLLLGYLLSPLCWWNDLIFNLPVAYGFGYICSFFAPKLLLPGTIIGYWLSNIIGILLMQIGVGDVLKDQSKEHNLKKELLTGLLSSTAYTLVILGLIQLKILDAPILFPSS